MDIKPLITASLSKRNAEIVAEKIGDSIKRFNDLIEILLSTDPQLALRASMAFSKCTDKYPKLIIPHLPILLQALEEQRIDGVKRVIVRSLQEIQIPNEYLGDAANVLFNLMVDNNQPVAVKVFTMTSLANICIQEPELSQELKMIIEDQIPYGSTGFKNRGAKIIKKLNSLIQN